MQSLHETPEPPTRHPQMQRDTNFLIALILLTIVLPLFILACILALLNINLVAAAQRTLLSAFYVALIPLCTIGFLYALIQLIRGAYLEHPQPHQHPIDPREQETQAKEN